MADIQINVDAGTQTRLLTAGKYCADNILLTAGPGSADASAEDAIVSGIGLTSYKNNRVSTIKQYCFAYSTIQDAFFGHVSSVQNSAFRETKQLSRVFLGTDLATIDDAAFQSSEIFYVIIPGQSMVTLVSVSAFLYTPINYGTGFIYVPDSLVEQYKAATNWSNYASQIKGLSEIPVDVQTWLEQMGGIAA